jgi:hypothetical protein
MAGSPKPSHPFLRNMKIGMLFLRDKLHVLLTNLAKSSVLLEQADLKAAIVPHSPQHAKWPV